MAAPGLYLHVPFCSRICPYCDFAVLTGGRQIRRRFVGRLIDEAALWADRRDDFQGLDTLYFGGGTPSILDPEDLGRILDAVRRHLDVAPDAMTFLEANPEDVTPESVTRWRRLGVRFLSLGVQSFADHELAFLGRRHHGAEARRSIELAQDAGFETVSFDLIYGLPGQTVDAWKATLDQALSLSPDHLSCYQLTFQEGTPFGFRHARGQLAELPEEGQAELFLLTHRHLADNGLPAYEVSNFARSAGHRSRHNRKYWHHVPYLGLGPSAHSFSGSRRWWNERKLGAYLARVEAGGRPVAGGEELLPRDLALEALLLGLRTIEGIDVADFERRFGVNLIVSNGKLVGELVEQGLLAPPAERLAATLAGLAVADGLAARFSGLQPLTATTSTTTTAAR
jgi:oxygen-independent coproporphyrinogen-3 oxidase